MRSVGSKRELGAAVSNVVDCRLGGGSPTFVPAPVPLCITPHAPSRRADPSWVSKFTKASLADRRSKEDTGAAKCINAKAETVATKPSFRAAFKSRPCLVPADGFYEWQKLPGGEKQPWFITTTFEEPFAFAGLWERWRPKDAPSDTPDLETFAILTTEPNPLCAPIHNRMPVMLPQDDWPRWLATPDDRKPLLRAFPAERMEAWPVGKAVGNVRNEGAELVSRVA